MKAKKGNLFAEFGRLSRNRMAMLSVAALAFIPLLYSGMLIGAFWDPYGKLDRLPVAVVNQDTGAVMDGKPIDAGQELVDELKGNSDFKWEFTDGADATKGLKEHKYAMAFVIPENFSKLAATLKDETPQPADIQYYVDDGWNYLNSRIGAEAAERLRSDVSRSVTKAYAQAVMDSVGQAADGLKQAGDGAAKLADGAAEAKVGAQRLHDNLAKLANGSLQLEQGMGKLQAGASTLAGGAHEAADGAASLAGGLGQLQAASGKLAEGVDRSAAAAGELAGGTSQLAANAKTLAGGLDELGSGGQAVSSGADQLAQGLEQYANAHGGMTDDAAFRKLLETAKQVAAGAGRMQQGAADLKQGADRLAGAEEKAAAGAVQLRDGLKQLGDGFGKFDGKLGEAAAGADRLASGTARVAAGADSLQEGIAAAGNGFSTVTKGTAQLAGGSADLAGGVGKLTDGSRELSDKLGTAAKDAGSLTGGDKTADMFAEPVSVSEHKLASIPNYGTGMTPYFLSLGLFVGVLLSTVILPLRDAPAGVTGGIRWYLSKVLLFAPLVLVQTAVVDTVLIYGLGLKVPHVAAFYGVTIVIALTFMTILQFLISLADQIGRFLGVILLTLQLASSAGTYPAELLPAWLQAVSPWMPMTHAIQALRLVIEGAPAADFAAPLYKLAAYAVVFVALTIGYFLYASRRGRGESEPTGGLALAE
ncbi:YhgE/Pip domain-containing protein [Cohnella sp. CFH 77786]|uniref:YhgE/Pip domain-containing protein n=1 Tax=Cohnella sp. CFH 77786 TaxID=2662265 RepID=UPI001C60CE8D|nr:YhgE/Pip domain-containing protein [Cohnella sp. CFH 77786]